MYSPRYNVTLPYRSHTIALAPQASHQVHTTAIERLFLMTLPALMPLEAFIPTLGGFSYMYVVFAILAGYVLLKRLTAANRTWLHPTFRTAYIFLLLVFLIEFSHSNASYSEIFQTAQLIAGGIVVASLCRDRSGLRACVYGYIAQGIFMSVMLFLSSYGSLSVASATDFHEASIARGEAARGLTPGFNLNGMARDAAQGGTLALAFALSALSLRWRIVFLAATLFCTLGAFLAMSRGGIMIILIAYAAVLWKYGINLKLIIVILVLGAGIFMLAPDVVFSRLVYSTEVLDGKTEARAQVYTAAIERFPDYALTGVGVSNFWDSWGFFNGFTVGRGSVVGAHNVFLQITIYWGLAGLLTFLALLLQAYRCLPKKCGEDVLGLCVMGLAVTILLNMCIAHDLIKNYSIGLGLIVGSHYWIWPRGDVPVSTDKKQRREVASVSRTI